MNSGLLRGRSGGYRRSGGGSLVDLVLDEGRFNEVTLEIGLNHGASGGLGAARSTFTADTDTIEHDARRGLPTSQADALWDRPEVDLVARYDRDHERLEAIR